MRRVIEMYTVLFDNDLDHYIPKSGKQLMDYCLEVGLEHLDKERLTDVARELGVENPEKAHVLKVVDAFYAADPMLKKKLANSIVDDVAEAFMDDWNLLDSTTNRCFREFSYACKEIGLFKKEEPYLIFGDCSERYLFSGYELTEPISNVDNLIIRHLFNNYPDQAQIYRADSQPYLNVYMPIHDECYTMVPMSWMEKALQSDVKDNIQEIMLRDDEVRDAVRKAVPSLVDKKEALTAMEDFAIWEAGSSYYNAKNKTSMDELSQALASFDFLKFKEDVDDKLSSDKREDVLFYDLAADVFFDKYNTGKYRLSGKPDEKLVEGIEYVLCKNNPREIKKMVDGLFGKNRVNTIHELKMIGSKDLSR